MRFVARLSSASTGLVEDIRLIAFLAWMKVYRRYCGSWFGIGWSLAHPMAYVMVMWFAFQTIMQTAFPNFLLYLTSGMMPWWFLSNSMITAASTFSNRKHELNCTTISPLQFVLADIGAEFVNFLAACLVMVVLAAACNGTMSQTLLLLPLAMIPLVAFAFGCGVLCAYLGARYRDIPHLLQVAMSLLFWLVPIIYHPSQIPTEFRAWVQLNPLAVLIAPFQVILHGQSVPTLKLVSFDLGFGVAILVLALWVDRKIGRRIVFDL